MVECGSDVGEAEVLKVKNKANKRRHGQRFGSEKEAFDVMYPGEMAVVVVDKSAIEFHGEPTRDGDEVENFLIGAQKTHIDKDVKVKIIKKSGRNILSF